MSTEPIRRALAGSVAIALVATLLGAACGQSSSDTTVGGGAEAEESTGSTSGDSASSTGDSTSSSSSESTSTSSRSTSTGESTSTTTGSSTTSPTPSSSPSSTSATGGGGGGGSLVDIHPVAIEAVSTVDARTFEITVLGGVAPCFIIDRVDVDETADRVTLTVHAGSEPGAICIQIIEEAMATVTLDRPLGDRQVVDGSDGSVVPVGSG